MNHHDLKRIAAVFTLAIVIVLPAGCDSAEELALPGPDVEAEVTQAARTGALAGPSGDVTGDMIAGMIGLIEPAVPAAPVCPESFELPGGISGTCTRDDAGVMTWLFAGIISVDGDDVSVEGSMNVAPSVEQPATGSGFSIEYIASAFGMRGSATWTASGTVLVGDAGDVVDYDLTMAHTVTPAGGETVVVRITVDPSMLDMSLTGPLGGAVGITLDHETMTGTLSLNGIQVATITITDGCATIVSGIPAIPDQTICAGPM